MLSNLHTVLLLITNTQDVELKLEVLNREHISLNVKQYIKIDKVCDFKYIFNFAVYATLYIVSLIDCLHSYTNAKYMPQYCKQLFLHILQDTYS